MIEFLISQCEQEPVSDKLDVLLHKFGIDSQQGTRKAVGEKPLLDSDSFGDDILDDLLARPFSEVAEEETGKVGVETFVSGDEFVGKGQAGHETAFLEPEDGSEGAREKDSLDSGERNEAFSEGGILIGNPTKSPFSLCFNTGDYY
jgi:hypothetical protein